jgi:hypothetical protein
MRKPRERKRDLGSQQTFFSALRAAPATQNVSPPRGYIVLMLVCAIAPAAILATGPPWLSSCSFKAGRRLHSGFCWLLLLRVPSYSDCISERHVFIGADLIGLCLNFVYYFVLIFLAVFGCSASETRELDNYSLLMF